MITQKKWNALNKKMLELNISESDIEEKFIRGSGKGGQKINKTSSCVQLLYNEIEIRCQKTRSQADNRFWARRELCEKVLIKINIQYSIDKYEIQKKHRQNFKISKNKKQKILDRKNQHGIKKKLRAKIIPE